MGLEEENLLELQGTRPRPPVHPEARIVNLAIDDIADCHYENPSGVHVPRGVGVAEGIIPFSETRDQLCSLRTPRKNVDFVITQILLRSVLKCECYGWVWSGEEDGCRSALSIVRGRQGRRGDG